VDPVTTLVAIGLFPSIFPLSYFLLCFLAGSRSELWQSSLPIAFLRCHPLLHFSSPGKARDQLIVNFSNGAAQGFSGVTSCFFWHQCVFWPFGESQCVGHRLSWMVCKIAYVHSYGASASMAVESIMNGSLSVATGLEICVGTSPSLSFGHCFHFASNFLTAWHFIILQLQKRILVQNSFSVWSQFSIFKPLAGWMQLLLRWSSSLCVARNGWCFWHFWAVIGFCNVAWWLGEGCVIRPNSSDSSGMTH